MRALGLIVSQGETKHMPSALLRLTFNTIYKLLKNHVSSETRAFEVFAIDFQFLSCFKRFIRSLGYDESVHDARSSTNHQITE